MDNLLRILMPIIVGAFLTGLCIMMFTAKSRWQNKIKAQPVISCKGTVTEKYMTVVNLYKSSKSVPHFAFEISEGQRLVIEMENEQYALIREGDKGTLAYRQYKGTNYFDNFKNDV